MHPIAIAVIVAVQCPDGSPPPCARPAQARPAAATIDRNRIAVLPFRVTTADSLLGEGLAELVATEFTGESGPRAVNMGTVLRAWRGAGGGLRAPLSQEGAIRLARDMGAGFYVEGSVVGLGSRLTINAAVVPVSGAGARRAAPVAGPADSLDLLVGRLTSTLLAAAGSERSAGRVRLTDSPAAMRWYLEGLAHWRRGGIESALNAFERAFQEDSTFARAALMRWTVGGWSARGAGSWSQTTWRLRQHLSSSDRKLLDGQLGPGYPAPRDLAQRRSDRERMAADLPESAEAQYFLGDYLYHSGSLFGPEALDQAREAFERSVALDPQGTVLQHLLELALITGDSALARRTWPAFDRTIPGSWDWGMAVGALIGDEALVAAQRRRAETPDDRLLVGYIIAEGMLPQPISDEIMQLNTRFSTPANPAQAVGSWDIALALNTGRPGRLRPAPGEPASAATTREWARATVLIADGDTAAGWSALRQLRTQPASTGAADLLCVSAFEPTSEEGGAATPPGIDARCQAIVTAVRAVRRRVADAGQLLAVADSLSRFTLGFGQHGFDRLQLALAWEAFGNPARALSAVRLRTYGGPPVFLEGPRLREEGRLALLAGDTVGARRAWSRYLRLRRAAEPSLVAQRDSVRAALAALR